MQVTLSAAVTADGYLDDNTPRRLIISSPEDLAEVYRLRASCDAIIVGAETIRRDDPSLVLRDEAAREQRRRHGLTPDIAKVTLTRSGRLDPAARFFTTGSCARYLFAPQPLPQFDAEVICCEEPLTARRIVTELERRGIERLMVEGGARLLDLFLSEGMADTLRLAVSPTLRLGADRGGARFAPRIPEGTPATHGRFGNTLVTLWQLRPSTEADDRRFLQAAIDVSRRCTPCASCYRVGAVVRTAEGALYTGYTHESSPTHHAEQEAIAKALAAGASLRGASIYTSMEPCSRRASEPLSCTELILRHGFAHVAFALYEPDLFTECRGALMLREAGVDVRAYPSMGDSVRHINGHLFRSE